MTSPRDVVLRLKDQTVEALADCRSDGPFSLVDFPNHTNVGDSAIYLGELRYFDEVWGRAPTFVCDMDLSPATVAARLPDGPVFFHGGGNFGDVWPEHHEWRLALMRLAPERTYVQLPQTVWFSDPKKADETARALGALKDYTLFVRDRQSLDYVSSRFDCPIGLCPDLAFFLGPQQPPAPKRYDEVLLLRSDHEAVGLSGAEGAGASSRVTDWLDEPRGPAGFARRALGALELMRPVLRQAADTASERVFRSLAERRVARGLTMLGEGRMVVTDRLHAHILSVLLGIPNVCLDNFYGKIRGYIDTWTHDCDGVATATSLSEALDLTRAARAAT